MASPSTGTSGALSTISFASDESASGPRSGSAALATTSRREPCSVNSAMARASAASSAAGPAVRKEMSNPTVAAPARPTPRSTRAR